MSDDPDPDLFSCPQWLKDHNQAIQETHALGLYADSIKRAVSELYDKDRERIPSFMRYLPKVGEQLIEEVYIYIPDVD